MHSAVDNLPTTDETRASQMLGKQVTIEFYLLALFLDLILIQVFTKFAQAGFELTP